MNRNNEQVYINNTQFMTLLVCLSWPTVINYASGMMARVVGRDMWISGIIGVLTTVLFILLVVSLGQKFPGKTIIEYSRSLLGFIPGKLLGLILSLYLYVTATYSVSMYIHHLTDYLLPETPFLVITVMHVLVISYFVWLGPEVIARFGIISFALALVFTFLVLLASLSEINFDRILPLFDAGLLQDCKASIKLNSFIGLNLIVVAMLLPMVREQKKAARSATLGVAIGGLIFIFYFIAELMVMGPQLVAMTRIASMDFVRSIQITQYLHRFESFMVALWYWSILVQGGILTYCAHLAFRQTVGIKRQNMWLVVLSGIIMVALTYLMAHNRVTFLNFKEYSWHYWALPVQFGVPLLLLLISFFLKPAAAGK